MGFGAPRDGAARAFLGVALTIQLLPLITAVIGASAILTLAMNDNLEFLVGFLSFGGALWALAFFFALIIMQPIAGMINLALMGGYLKRVSLSLGLPAADATSLMRRVWWKFGFFGFTVSNLLLEPIIGLGINYLLALLGGLPFAFSILWRISITLGSCRAPVPLSSFSRIKSATLTTNHEWLMSFLRVFRATPFGEDQ